MRLFYRGALESLSRTEGEAQKKSTTVKVRLLWFEADLVKRHCYWDLHILDTK